MSPGTGRPGSGGERGKEEEEGGLRDGQGVLIREGRIWKGKDYNEQQI